MVSSWVRISFADMYHYNTRTIDRKSRVMKTKIKKYINKYKQEKSRGRNYFKWLTDYTKPYMWKIIALMAISIGMTYVSIYYAIISQKLVDLAGEGITDKRVIIIYMFLIFFQLGVNAVTDLALAMINERYSFGIRKQVYDKLLRSSWLGTQKFHTGDMMTRMTSDAGNIANGMVNVIPNIIVLMVQLISVFITFYIYSPFLAVSALCLTPMGLLAAYILGRKLKKLQENVLKTETAYRSFIQESLANIMVVKAFSNEESFSEQLVKLRDERFFWVWKKSKMSTLTNTVMMATFNIGSMLAFLYAAYGISKGEITFGTMTLFLTLFSKIQAPIISLASQLPGVVSIFASAGRVMDIQDIAYENRLEEVSMEGSVGVEVRAASFAYAEDNVLEDVSFEIKPSEFVAIVGKSGIGKTTLIRLLMSFVDARSGDITYKDNYGHQTPVNASVRSFISYVPQGNTLFSGTIRDNILMGKMDATEDEINEALEMAVCNEFIGRLPNGLDTVIGEKGVGLSEGQAQRIAIARALIKKSPFMILDEATSALDEDTELELLKKIGNMNPKPTCLLITHRRSILQYCSREIKISDKHVYVS